MSLRLPVDSANWSRTHSYNALVNFSDVVVFRLRAADAAVSRRGRSSHTTAYLAHFAVARHEQSYMNVMGMQLRANCQECFR
ncbi:hypothetical protein ACMHYO_07485 [Allopusillimonas ginsengisoli]|uniref:hypothetical protein n=1 Tax=Allopusillimonas ginsengisoli TaxID=453575 RepID=UPI0039C008B0